MDVTTQGNELSVAILMDDLASAKEISAALRNLGIFAHHYHQLDEFWAASNIQIPDLLFIDVTKLSQGIVQFKNHPKVVDGNLAFVLFSKDSTKVLLKTSLNLKPFAYINLDVSLPNQIDVIVHRRSREITFQAHSREMEQRLQRLQSRSQRMINERSEAEEFKAQFEFVKNLCLDIESDGIKSSFLNSLANKLESWEVVDGYGFYELNQTGQKLTSPAISKKKYHPFPSLWLGQVNLNGIEVFAEEMGTQVAMDLFDRNPKVLKIHGSNSNPEILFYIILKNENNFPWSLFEFMLSSSFRKIKIVSDTPKLAGQNMSTWEGLDYLDKSQILQGENQEVRVIGMSLLPLCEVVKKRVNNKFYWTSFYQELSHQFSNLLQKTTKISSQGPWNILFFVKREFMEVELSVLQMILKNLTAWKYFEDDSQVLTEDITPRLKILPLSSSHYLRSFEKEIQDHLFAGNGQQIQRISMSKQIRT